MQDNKTTVAAFWQKIDDKQWDDLTDFFASDAEISWPNTAEIFDIPRFIAINRNYPGSWRIDVEKILSSFNTVISVVAVSDGVLSFHAVSFFYFIDGKIAALQEYWGDDGEPPLWRLEIK